VSIDSVSTVTPAVEGRRGPAAAGQSPREAPDGQFADLVDHIAAADSPKKDDSIDARGERSVRSRSSNRRSRSGNAESDSQQTPGRVDAVGDRDKMAAVPVWASSAVKSHPVDLPALDQDASSENNADAGLSQQTATDFARQARQVSGTLGQATSSDAFSRADTGDRQQDAGAVTLEDQIASSASSTVSSDVTAIVRARQGEGAHKVPRGDRSLAGEWSKASAEAQEMAPNVPGAPSADAPVSPGEPARTAIANANSTTMTERMLGAAITAGTEEKITSAAEDPTRREADAPRPTGVVAAGQRSIGSVPALAAEHQAESGQLAPRARAVEAIQSGLSSRAEHAFVMASQTTTRFNASPVASDAPTFAPNQVDMRTIADETDVTRQIVQAVRMQWREGSGDARLTLRPEYLGEVTIALRVENGGVTAHVSAEVPSVRAWVSEHEAMLRETLSTQGLQLNRLVVSAKPDEAQPEAEKRRQQAAANPAPPRRRRDSGVFEVIV
jgi:flagellar hook-length control protein FliK